MLTIEHARVSPCILKSKAAPSGQAALVCGNRLLVAGRVFSSSQYVAAQQACQQDERDCVLLADGDRYLLCYPVASLGRSERGRLAPDRRILEIAGHCYRCFAAYCVRRRARAQQHYQLSLETDPTTLLLVDEDGCHTLWRCETMAAIATLAQPGRDRDIQQWRSLAMTPMSLAAIDSDEFSQASMLPA